MSLVDSGYCVVMEKKRREERNFKESSDEKYRSDYLIGAPPTTAQVNGGALGLCFIHKIVKGSA